MSFGSFKIMNGKQTHFWLDTWLGNRPLKDRFPTLFNIVRINHNSVAKVLSSVPLNISFRRNLVGRNLRDWHRIVNSLLDVFIWALHSSGSFSVKSIYVALINTMELEFHKIFSVLKFLQK